MNKRDQKRKDRNLRVRFVEDYLEEDKAIESDDDWICSELIQDIAAAVDEDLLIADQR